MMKAGEYYVGDLCYVLGERWDEFCDLTIQGNKCVDGEFTLKDGTKFVTYGTAYGDGCYNDQHGNDYPVDAGLIGCVETKYVDEHVKDTDTLNGLGAVHIFTRDFDHDECDGIIRFGNLEINTAGSTSADDIDDEGDEDE